MHVVPTSQRKCLASPRSWAARPDVFLHRLRADKVTCQHPIGVKAGEETVRSAARKLLAANPDFTIQRYLAIPGFQDMPEYRD